MPFRLRRTGATAGLLCVALRANADMLGGLHTRSNCTECLQAVIPLPLV